MEEIIKSNITTDWKKIILSLVDNNINTMLEEHNTNFKDDFKIFPPNKLIFNCFNHFNLSETKVVILGQDPYHGEGQAMGLCFSVPKNIEIKDKKFPPSLKNIFKEISSDEDIANNDKNILLNHGDLTNWAKQGVLLLNTALTVRERCPMSHTKYWKNFTDILLEYISKNTSQVIFVLWGSPAKNRKKLIDTNKHYILEATHPSPLGANKGGWFGCKHFSKINALLEQNNKTPINWNLT